MSFLPGVQDSKKSSQLFLTFVLRFKQSISMKKFSILTVTLLIAALSAFSQDATVYVDLNIVQKRNRLPNTSY